VNGIHDMGGMHGFGPIRPRENDEIFHAEWEKRVPGMRAVVGRHRFFTLDQARFGIERMEPAHYLTASYYERHLFAFELNLVESGVLSRAEIEARIAQLDRTAAAPPSPKDTELAGQVVQERLRSELPPRPDADAARFKEGDAVRARNVHPTTHTRLPRYARGKRGVIALFHGVEPLPDVSALGQGLHGEPLYNVRFEATELWGASAEGRGVVHLDLWESYLEPLPNEEKEEEEAAR
jgi:nitrile hydratase